MRIGKDFSMISSTQELKELVARARKIDCVALDTEFIWERTFYPQLGLIQLALSDEDCHLIDPVAIKDLTPLGKLLSDRNVVKIFHDAPQDLIILSRVTKAIPANIFDTRIASGFSGLPSTISLVNLVNVLLDIELPKTQTRTNWFHRPLSDEQIDYALDDVRYLRAIRVLLLTRIIVPEIKSWLRVELDTLNDPQSYIGCTDYERFQKIKGAGSLDRNGLAVLRELAAWREQEARHLNRPRGHVVTDKNLLELARQEVNSFENLEQSGLLNAKKLQRFGEAIIKCITTGKSAAGDDRPEIRKPIRLNTREKQVFERLASFVQLKCDMQGIDPHLIGTTAELKQLARNLNSPGAPLPPRLTHGWRKMFLEEFFRQRL
ncbi:MAG: HRDC domain-containing protein [Deltaproteobacteria bacterium]|nr:HRDC domain-containing protein [Deltaproteobacteria bacterium]